MEWGTIWRTVFVGWDGDVDLAALAEELRQAAGPRAPVRRSGAAGAGAGDRDSASAWVCQQIQSAY
jgi:hypothetical protein